MEYPIKVIHPITRLIVGGAQENTLYTAERLDKKVFQVDVLSGIQTGSEGSLIDEARQRGIPLILLPELRREISPRNDKQAIAKLRRILRQNNYKIVHTHSSKAGILGRSAAVQEHIPNIVHTVHGWSFHQHMDPVRKYAYILLEKRFAKFTDGLIFVSKRDIHKAYEYKIGNPEKFHLIRSAIPLDDFNPDKYDRDQIRQKLGIPLDAIVIGNVGRLSEQKDPLSWIDVAHLVSRQSPDCLFLLVGDGPLRGQVEKAIQTAGLENRVILTGIRRDIPELLACMDVFLLTSLWEGLPRVILQACAMGVPVVANQVDGISDVIMHGESGFTEKPGDKHLLAEDCLRLVEDSRLRSSIGKSGRDKIESEYSLELMIDQITRLYHHLLERKS
jgi:glycosyltransferase involved in cell wall biosynthesis